MNFELFVRLYGEALEYSDIDYYIAERGWQVWMEQYEVESVIEILTSIFNLSKLDIGGLRNTLNMPRAKMSKMYGIPIRTLENWDSGTSEPASYVKILIAYTVFNHKEDAQDDIES